MARKKSSSVPNGKVRFTLFENALDFVVEAIERISGDPDASGVKYGVLHLAAGVELLLKERLRRQDPALIFSDPKKYSDQALKSGNFVSAYAPDVLKRLEACGVRVSPGSLPALSSLRLFRNQLKHFGIEPSHDALVATAAGVM